MTICLAVKTGEGLVMAADSQSTLSAVTPNGEGVVQLWEHASKLTRFKNYPVGMMTWGVGAIENRTFLSLVMEFERDWNEYHPESNYAVRDIAQQFLDFVKEKYNGSWPLPLVVEGHAPNGAEAEGLPPPSPPQPEIHRPTIGIAVGGFSHQQFFAELHVCEYPQNDAFVEPIPDEAGKPNFGFGWWGQRDALFRLIKGISREALEFLRNNGAPAGIIDQMQTGMFDLSIEWGSMPLQDAIDFVEYAAVVTIGRHRFAVGPPFCGGAVDVAVLTPGRFRWAKRKQWSIKGKEDSDG